MLRHSVVSTVHEILNFSSRNKTKTKKSNNCKYEHYSSLFISHSRLAGTCNEKTTTTVKKQEAQLLLGWPTHSAKSILSIFTFVTLK